MAGDINSLNLLVLFVFPTVALSPVLSTFLSFCNPSAALSSVVFPASAWSFCSFLLFCIFVFPAAAISSNFYLCIPCCCYLF